MKPVMQSIRHDPKNGFHGDCQRAVLASVFDFEIDEVPHFYNGKRSPEDAADHERAWLLKLGIVPIHIPVLGTLDEALAFGAARAAGCYCVFAGRSPRGNNHAVVSLDGEIVHDPSPDGGGIIAPCDDGFYWWEFFGAARVSVRAA